MRTLCVEGLFNEAPEEFSAEDLGRLVAVVGPSLTELWIGPGLYGLYYAPSFWESLRDFAARHGLLCVFVVEGVFADVFESDLEPLAQLAGSLEQLKLNVFDYDEPKEYGAGYKLKRFPESLCALTELRYLEMTGQDKAAAKPPRFCL